MSKMKFFQIFRLPENYKFFIKFFIMNIFIFELFRLFFMLNFHSQFVGVPVLDILKSFLIGIRLDIYTINYGIAPFFLFGCLPYIGIESSPKIKKVYVILMSILFGVLYFLHLANIEFYKEYSSHLNFTAIQYLDSSGLILFMIIKKYHLFRYVFLFILLMLLYKYLMKKFVIPTTKAKVSIIKRIILYPIFLGLLFVGIRGGVSLGIMDWGVAFFSKYNIVNQATLNPIFNFTKDIYYMKKNETLEKFKYFNDEKEALKIAQDILIPNEKKNIIDEKYPLYRRTVKPGPEKKYNVVIILMEEFAAEYVGCLGNKTDLNLTPRFDELAKFGVLFTNFYSNGQRTNAGISSTICSYIPMSGHSIMTRVEGQQKINSVASILKEKGYETFFMYGGDTKFDNMQGFLIPKGFDEVVNQQDFPTSLVLNKWGIPDEYVFDRLLARMDETNKKGKPFCGMILTLSNHPPYTLPHNAVKRVNTNTEFDDNYNTFVYADQCLGEFIDEVKKREYFKNTIFVILGDHSKTLHYDLDLDYRKSFVPCLFYAPYILKPKISDKIAGQIDITPTIFSILNMSTLNSFCGKDMLLPKDEKRDFAIILSGIGLGYIKNGFYYYTKIGSNDGKLYKYNIFDGINYRDEMPGVFHEMEKESYALEESTYRLFKDRRIAKA